MAIKSRKQQDLLGRECIIMELYFDKAVPSNDEARKKVAHEVKVEETLVVIKKIANAYGSTKADVTAFVYKDAGTLKKIEPKPKEKKKKAGEEEAAPAAPAKK